MKELSVRIEALRLINFKNVKNGEILMPSFYKKEYFSKDSDVLGIYGQNGSGKTSVIEALSIIKRLLSGKSLGKKTLRYFAKDEKTCSIFVKFLIEYEETSHFVDYFVEFTKENDDFFISKENLSTKEHNYTKFLPLKTIISFDGDDFLPKSKLKELSKIKDYDVELKIAKRYSKRHKTSIVFGETGYNLLTSDELNHNFIIKSLAYYVKNNFFVVTSSDTTLSHIKFFTSNFDCEKSNISINLNEFTILTADEFFSLKTALKDINNVLNTIIPDLQIGMVQLNDVLHKDLTASKKVQLTSIRDELEIPLNLESEGILKIISVLNLLISVYHNRSICLVVDEFDAGIYEYLLGELVSIFYESAKGQLIFTSHNLRILEMIDKTSIIFSTTNQNNRYIRLKNIKNIHNLRDIYLRSIALGGNHEEIYKETDSSQIARAFRTAKKVNVYERK